MSELYSDASVKFNPSEITPDEFIRTVYGTRDPATEEVCLATAPLDDAAPWLQRAWRDGADHRGATHVCISTVKPRPFPETLKSRAVDLVRAHLVVFDDVGTDPEKSKAHPDAIACKPSYRIETSPNNYQYGFLLKEPVDPQRAAALAKVAARAQLTDPKTADANRVVRLPGSIKPGAGFAARLTSWNPERTYTLEELAAELGLDQEAIEVAVRNPSSTSDMSLTAEELARYRVTDPVLAGLDALDMIKEGLTNGYVSVVCPWADLHGKDDDATGYAPKTGHFKCFHSDGTLSDEGKTRTDVIEWLAEKLGHEAWTEIRQRAAVETFKAAPLTEGADTDIMPPSKTEAEALERRLAAEIEAAKAAVEAQKPKRRQWARIGTAPVEPEFERERIADCLTIGEVTQTSAQPGIGKSMLVFNRICAMITERHDLVGESEPFERTGDVFIVSNEDTPEDFIKRRNAWLAENGMTEADVKHEVYVNKAPDFVAVQSLGRGMPVAITPDMLGLAEDIREDRASGRNVSLLVLDTQNTVFQVDENDNNAQGNAYRALREWSQANRVASWMIHHTTKEAGRTGAIGITASRGGSGAMASARHGTQIVGLTEAEAKQLPEGEAARWIREETTKGNHREPGKNTKWYYKRSVKLATKRKDGGIGKSESVGTLVFMPKGPQIGADVSNNDLLMNALLAVWDADRKGAPLFTAEKGNSPRRACVAVGNAVAGSVRDAGARNAMAAQFLAELSRQGLIERDVLSTSDHKEVEVWRPTPKGAELATERSVSAFDAPPIENIEAPVAVQASEPLAAETDDPNVVPLKPRAARRTKAPKVEAPAPKAEPARPAGEDDGADTGGAALVAWLGLDEAV